MIYLCHTKSQLLDMLVSYGKRKASYKHLKRKQLRAIVYRHIEDKFPHLKRMRVKYPTKTDGSIVTYQAS